MAALKWAYFQFRNLDKQKLQNTIDKSQIKLNEQRIKNPNSESSPD
jgi:hypothetical protein